MASLTLNVEGMSCQHCVNRVKKALEGVTGVDQADVDLDKAKAEVNGLNLDAAALTKAIEQAGYKAQVNN